MTNTNKKIEARIRENNKEEVKEGSIPAVLYGPKKKNTILQIDQKEFSKLYKEVGGSTLITISIDGKDEKSSALIHDIQREPLSGKIIHVDFFEPNLKEEVEAEVQLVFIGVAPAVKDLNGTLVKNIFSVEVKALPQNLPHEIEVNLESLLTFEDAIHIKDLKISEDVKIMQDAEAVIAMVSRPQKVEEELEKPIEEGKEAEVVGEKEKADKEKEGKEE
jgi:large subunit ribosomal protein L25